MNLSCALPTLVAAQRADKFEPGFFHSIHSFTLCARQAQFLPLFLMCLAGGMSGGIPGGTAGQSGQERQDVAGTGAGATGNQSGDTAGRQIEGARGQGLSGQVGVY